MAPTKQQRERQTQLDDGNGTRSTDFDDVDGGETDEISSSMNVISTAEERRQRHQGSGDDNGLSDDSASQVDDLQDELRPKDGSFFVTADSDTDADDEMPSGLAKKQGWEDYNPAARPHVRAGDSTETAK